jgi:hypothetical protein
MSLELFGYKTLREKINQEKKWLKNYFLYATGCRLVKIGPGISGLLKQYGHIF